MRKILIVDDMQINREILKKILGNEYDLIEADNGEDALHMLHRYYKMLSAVVLDLMMPEPDGYEILRQMRDNVALSQLPVIVVTSSNDEESRVRALALGANDFVTKPYNNEIIKHCLKNNIQLRETASIVNALQHDKLTGIYSREAFFEKAFDIIKEKEPGAYVMTCLDIDNFKLINDQYGAAEGDRILKYIGSALKSTFDKVHGVCGRISGDNFAGLFPNNEEALDYITQCRKTKLLPIDIRANITISVGRYVVNDIMLSASSMYDRAYIAKQSVKGKYDNHIGYFDNSMLDTLIQQQKITSEMDAALAGGQFEIWFQPQVNHSTGRLIGSEALVRWRHPERGIISPGVFIPVFEKNGFIYELDKYVWQQTCGYLRKWLDEGRDPLPVSVNISRYDIFREDLIDVINGLVIRYDLPTSLLRLEITESAFAQSAEQIINIVKRLIDNGYIVEIDDFGSGYSSLNTLKDVPANVLKLDMRFLENSNASQRGGNILESIVRMAKWLGMAVIAEGVEEPEQAEFLKTIGCDYIQGYLYARPMPAEAYERYSVNMTKEPKMLTLETVENLNNNKFWDPNSLDTLIFNSFVGGACIIEYGNGSVEVLRANEKFAQILSGGTMSIGDILKLDFMSKLEMESLVLVSRNVQESILTLNEVTDEYVFIDLPGCPHKTYLRATIRVIASAGNRHLVYVTSENITAQRQAENKEHSTAERLEVIMNNVNSGVSAMTSEDGVPHFIFTNKRFYSILGYTRETYEAEVKHPFEMVHPDDRAKLDDAIAMVFKSGEPAIIPFRCYNRDGELMYIRCSASMTQINGVNGKVQLSVLSDITELKLAEQRVNEISEQLYTIIENVSGGITAIKFDENSQSCLLFANDAYYTLFGYTREQYKSDIKSLFDIVHPDDTVAARAAVANIIKTRTPAVLEYRVRKRNGEYVYIRSNNSIIAMNGENNVMLSVLTDVTKRMLEKDQQKELLDNLPCGAGLYEYNGDNITVVHLNKRFMELVNRSDSEISLNAAADSIHPDDKEYVMSELKAMLKYGRYAVGDIRVLYGKDSYRLFHVIAKAVLRSDGIYSIYTAFTPVTEGNMTLRESMPYILSAIMETSSSLSFAKDRNFKYICCSNAYARLIGYESENSIIGKKDHELLPAETADRYKYCDIELISGGQQEIDVVVPMKAQDGKLCYIKTTKRLLKDASGDIIGIYGISQDITKNREAYAQLKLLTDSIPGGLATYTCTNGEIKITYFSEGFCGLLGYTRDEYNKISEHSPSSCVFKEDLHIVMNQVKDLIENDVTILCTYRIHTKDGGYKWLKHRGVATDRYGDTVVISSVLFDVTEEQEATEKIRMREEEYRLAMECSRTIVCRYDVKKHSLTMSPSVAVVFGTEETIYNVPYGLVANGMIDPQCAKAYIDFYEAIMKGSKNGSAVFMSMTTSGWRWYESHYSTIFSDNGEPASAVISLIDVTDELEKESIYKRWQQSLKQRAPDSYTLFRCNLSKNASFDSTEGALLKIEFSDNVQTFNGRTIEYASKFVFEGDYERYTEFLNADTLLANYYRGKRLDIIEYREKTCDGHVRWLQLTIDLVEYPKSHDIEAFLMFENIDAVKRAELSAIERAETDLLTGVYNRATFAEKMTNVIGHSPETSLHALLMIDFDGFKRINDTLGIAEGDEIITDMAKVIRSVLRRGDLIGRLGGDEFGVFLSDLPNSSAGAEKARLICELTRKTFKNDLKTSSSIGIVMYPQDGTDFELLYTKACDALSYVKKSGKDNYAFYSDDMKTATT